MKKFNLQDEPWILTTNLNGNQEQLSLTDTLIRSHELKGLSGETLSQDIAILRLLLGVMYAVYTQTDEYKSAINADQCIKFWKSMWLKKHLPLDEIKNYLTQHHDRFWLRHPQFPFYQLPSIKKGSEFSSSKMIGDLVEGGNKIQLFSFRSGENKRCLTYPEATRWLLYLNSFDDASAKPSQKGLHPMSVGWLGQLGIVYLKGSNLFETLMLNFVLINGRNNKPWDRGTATWELSTPKVAERELILMPESATELFTLQSRRIQLHWENDNVVGYTLLGGDGFSSENAFAEPMTFWKAVKDKDDAYAPPSNAGRNPSKQLWRDFASLFATSEGTRRPGVLSWSSKLEGKDIISAMEVQICTMQIKYGNMQSGVDEMWGDSLSVNSSLLLPLGEVWINHITTEIAQTENFVKVLGNLASDLTLASGSSDGSSARIAAQELAYATLDMPFRKWLASISPTSAEEDEYMYNKLEEWASIAKTTILSLGEGLAKQAGTQAFVGRTIKVNKKETHYSTSICYRWFRVKIHAIVKGGN